MKKIMSIILSLAMAAALAVSGIIPASADSSAFSVSIEADAGAALGGTATVRVTFSDLTATLRGFAVPALRYDSSALELKGEPTLSRENWEMGFSDKNGVLMFMITESTSNEVDYMKKGDSLTMTLVFTVKAMPESSVVTVSAKGSEILGTDTSYADRQCELKKPEAEIAIRPAFAALGAQIKDAENATDLRFIVSMASSFADENIANITDMGALITRKDLFGGELTLEAAEKSAAVKKLVTGRLLVQNGVGGCYVYPITVAGVTDDAAEYVIRPYYVLNGETVYAAPITRTVAAGKAA